MRIFVTGATGFVGSYVVKELIAAGHEVLGLARSDTGAQALKAAGANVQRGSLEDIESLKNGTAASEAVIHLGMSHDLSDLLKIFEIDKQAIEAMGSVLAGSDRPLIVATGIGGLAGRGQFATEETVVPPDFPIPRVSEQTALAQVSKGVCASVMRLPQVHDTRKQGLITTRQIVESEAIRLAALHGDHAWRDSVIASFALYERDIREHGERAVDWKTTEPRHHQFHKAVVSGCPFTTLRGICDSIHQRLTRYRLQLDAYRFGPDEVIGEHRLLMEAVLSGNGDRAHAAARSHFGLSLSILETELQSRPALIFGAAPHYWWETGPSHVHAYPIIQPWLNTILATLEYV
jgi:FCD domain/NAD dependent epimerase/dehydratase family